MFSENITFFAVELHMYGIVCLKILLLLHQLKTDLINIATQDLKYNRQAEINWKQKHVLVVI